MRASADQTQVLDRQVDALTDAGAEKVIVETGSGAKDRPILREALGWLRAGDVLMVEEVSRLGRRATDLIAIADDLSERGIHLMVTTLGVDTRTPAGRMVYTVLAAAAQLERELLAERTSSALEARRRRGVLGGRPRKLTPKQAKAAHALRLAGDLSMAEIAEQMRCSRSTLYRELARVQS